MMASNKASNKALCGRGTAFYKCGKCSNEWIDKESIGEPDTCLGCGKTEVEPYRFEKKKRRKFGEFECGCGNRWSSGNAWEGMGQQCLKCEEMILPCTLRPLRRSKAGGGPAHEQALCEMCQEIGGNCRELKESDSDDDEDEAESVVSTISTVSSAGTVTPDEEEYSEGSGSSGSDTEDELAYNLNRLAFPK